MPIGIEIISLVIFVCCQFQLMLRLQIDLMSTTISIFVLLILNISAIFILPLFGSLLDIYWWLTRLVLDISLLYTTPPINMNIMKPVSGSAESVPSFHTHIPSFSFPLVSHTHPHSCVFSQETECNSHITTRFPRHIARRHDRKYSSPSTPKKWEILTAHAQWLLQPVCSQGCHVFMRWEADWHLLCPCTAPNYVFCALCVTWNCRGCSGTSRSQ